MYYAIESTVDNYEEIIKHYYQHVETSTDTNNQIAQAKLQPYLQEIASWTQKNQLHLNPDKTNCTLFTPDSAEYSTQLTLNIDNVVIPTVKNPKILGLTFDPKLTYN